MLYILDGLTVCYGLNARCHNTNLNIAFNHFWPKNTLAWQKVLQIWEVKNLHRPAKQ